MLNSNSYSINYFAFSPLLIYAKTPVSWLKKQYWVFVFQSVGNASDIIFLGTSLNALLILHENHFFFKKKKSAHRMLTEVEHTEEFF